LLHCWFLTNIFTRALIFKGLTARRLYKSFGVKWLISQTDLLGMPNSMEVLLQNLPPDGTVRHNSIQMFDYIGKYKPPGTTKFISALFLARCFGFGAKPSLGN
jgi:hypothetical protein